MMYFLELRCESSAAVTIRTCGTRGSHNQLSAKQEKKVYGVAGTHSYCVRPCDPHPRVRGVHRADSLGAADQVDEHNPLGRDAVRQQHVDGCDRRATRREHRI